MATQPQSVLLVIRNKSGMTVLVPAGGCSGRGVQRKRGGDHRSHQEDCGCCSSYWSGRGACTADGRVVIGCPRGCGNRGCGSRGCRGGGGGSGGLAGAQISWHLYNGGASAAGGGCICSSRGICAARGIRTARDIRTARGLRTARGTRTAGDLRTARSIRRGHASASEAWCIRATRGRTGGSEASGAHQVAGASCRCKALESPD